MAGGLPLIRGRVTALVAVVAAGLVALLCAATAGAAAREQSTELISRAADGGLPNGASTNAVISNDKRYARIVAYQSAASDIVAGDTNGVEDVFAVLREGPVNNEGDEWVAGRTVLVSRTRSGEPANGRSFSPVVDGAFHSKPRCVGFLSEASNLVAGDSNGKVDAFVSRGPGGAPTRVSLPGGRQSSADTTGLAISGDCSRVAFVVRGRLYVRIGRRTKAVRTRGAASDPSFSTGLRNDLVFAAGGGAYLARGGTGRPKLVAPGGSNPAYNDIKRQVVAYERSSGGHRQVFSRDLGKRPRLVSARGSMPGNGDSHDPVIGNAGYYISFESDASNLGVNASGRSGDQNDRGDVYLYTDVRKITLVQSVQDKAVPLPGGGRHPSMSFYANYIVFDSPIVEGTRLGLPRDRLVAAGVPSRGTSCPVTPQPDGRCVLPFPPGTCPFPPDPDGLCVVATAPIPPVPQPTNPTPPLRGPPTNPMPCTVYPPPPGDPCIPYPESDESGTRGGTPYDNVTLGEPQVYMRWLGPV